MRVGISTDHGGFGLKEDLIASLRAAGHEIVDFGADALQPGDDYLGFVIPLAKAVAAGKVERGVAVCGSGVCANKIPGVHAFLIGDHFSTRQGVEDDHMNTAALKRAGGHRAGFHLRMGEIRWSFGPGDWHDDLRGIGATEGTAVKVRVRALAVGGGCEGVTRQEMRRFLQWRRRFLRAI
jgi:ribose 5-phosphate isomerase B